MHTFLSMTVTAEEEVLLHCICSTTEQTANKTVNGVLPQSGNSIVYIHVCAHTVSFPPSCPYMWLAPTKGALSRWGWYELQAKKWRTVTMSSTWLSYLGPIRATGKEVKDNHYVLHLTPTLQLATPCLSFEIRAWFNYQGKLHSVYFLTVPISQKW